ncbi:hypothetical protein [Polyangium aurulentum]|uniref:hypothetical protein n=1 Tax=Polyangium aurulentum TaxID=2567896 RepID=UPI0010AEDDE8|nr:hypothetical protein [Polyangium aurulentum]UQA59069.1 hypothetical protein E8A73_000680 [Polyangium aurulentum]
MSETRETWEIYVPWTDPETWRQKNDWLKQWRRDWKGHIAWSFATAPAQTYGPEDRGRKRVAVIHATPAALAELLPVATCRPIPPLEPVWGLRATVNDEPYDSRGTEVIGTKHFAPGSPVYPHRQYSGDGYERTYVTGKDRETGRYASIIYPVWRFRDWEAVLLDVPAVIYRMRGPAGWTGLPGEQEEAEGIARLMNERVAAGWPQRG